MHWDSNWKHYRFYSLSSSLYFLFPFFPTTNRLIWKICYEIMLRIHSRSYISYSFFSVFLFLFSRQSLRYLLWDSATLCSHEHNLIQIATCKLSKYMYSCDTLIQMEWTPSFNSKLDHKISFNREMIMSPLA